MTRTRAPSPPPLPAQENDDPVDFDGDTQEVIRRLPTAQELLPWHTIDVSIEPFGDGWWSFNPSIHYSPLERVWRLAYRVSNYSMPGGVVVVSTYARGKTQTRNVMAILNPKTLRPEILTEIQELDGRPRIATCGSFGYEDVRLFRTSRYGLTGIATSFEHNFDYPGKPEMILIRFDDEYNIVGARPLRGEWGGRPQKNWSPYDGVAEPRFLYSIERGVAVGENGGIPGSAPAIAPSTSPAIRGAITKPPSRGLVIGAGGVEVKITPRVPQQDRRLSAPPAPTPRSDEMRGGSQLVSVGDDYWLGIAHEMLLTGTDRRKYYWHTFYACDSLGRLLARSEPFKLSGAHGIEFAAGLAVDGLRVVVSYGLDDAESWLAVTDLEAVLGLLRPTGPWRKET